MSKKKNPSSLLPTKPPKRTGRRGILPKEEAQEAAVQFMEGVKGKKALTGKPALDVLKDFDSPVTKQQPMGSLLTEQPAKPSVANGRFKAFYDKPHITKVKDRILVALQFSVPLEEDHADLLPKIVEDAHRDVQKKSRIRINLNGIPAQHAAIYLSSDHKEELLVMPACKMTNVNVAIVERKGEGSARKVVRLSFRLQAEHSRELAHFAELNLSNDFWITLEDSQESLWDEEED